MELYITLSLLSVLLSLTLAYQIRRVDREQRYYSFVLLMVAAATWAFFSIFWLLLPMPWIVVSYKLSFLGIIALPVLLYLTSTEYAGENYLPFQIPKIYLWVMPCISLLLLATNGWHGLFWKEISPGATFDGIQMYQYIPAAGYWVHTAYSYLLIAAALVTFFMAFYKKRSPWLLLLVLGGIMVPVTANVLVVTGVTLIDYTPIMLSFACVGFGWTISVSFYTESISSLEKLQQKTSDINSLYQVIVALSEQLIQAELDDVDDAIDHALYMLGTQNGADRVYIFEHDEETDTISNTFEWCNKGITPEKERLQRLPFDIIPTWKKVFDNNEHVYIESVKELPDDHEGSEKELLLSQGIESLIVVPLFFGKRFFGFYGFDSVNKKTYWDGSVIALMRMMGNIIAGNISRVRFEKLLLQEKHNAEAANRVKSEFLANMSHELRTPMNAILGFSRIAADTTDDKEVQEHLEIVLNSGHSLLQLINDLLDFSKIEAGVLKLLQSETRLSTILKFVRQTFDILARQKGLILNIEVDPAADQAYILDESRLRQVLFNLVGNAVKFTHEGQVDLLVTATPSVMKTESSDKQTNPSKEETTTGPEKYVDLHFTVRDTGIGIAENDRQAIFEVFNQLSRGAGRKYEGTGLGLNISRRIVELMNGTITVESQLGKGSTFHVTIPFIKAI